MIDNQSAKIKKESKALIYPAHTVAGYGHIFSLGIEDIHVVALSHYKCANFESRYVNEKYVVPDPTTNHERFVSWLIDYGKQQQSKSVLFLADDVFAYIVSLYQNELNPYYLYPYIAHSKLDIFFNKKAMFREAAKADIILPLTLFSPLTNEELSKWKCFPAITKPLVSRFTFEGKKLVDVVKFPTLFGGKAVQVSNSQELQDIVWKLNQENIEYCIQPLIPGENKNIANIKFVSDKDGNIPSCFISRKIRQQPADFGTCCVARSEYIKSLHKYAEDFCKVTEYVGPGGMEFKWNSVDKKWYFIEVNPRLDFWIRMSAIKGINLPVQQYLLSTEQKLFRKKQLNKGRYWIDIAGDLKGLKWRKDKKEWKLSFNEIIKPYFNFNEAIFNLKDPMPGLKWIFNKKFDRLKNKAKQILMESFKYIFITILFNFLPDNDFGNKMRGRIFKPLLKKCGLNFRVAPQVRILRPRKLSVGNNVYLGFNSYVGEGTVEIEDNVVIGNFVSITASNHRRINNKYHGTGFDDIGIRIKENSWIGAHVSILGGATIGSGCVVASGAVVNSATKDNALLAGMPATEKKYYD